MLNNFSKYLDLIFDSASSILIFSSEKNLPTKYIDSFKRKLDIFKGLTSGNFQNLYINIKSSLCFCRIIVAEIFKVRKNVSFITPEDSYSIQDNSTKCPLSSIYPNIDHFVLSSYPSGQDGYDQILWHVFIHTPLIIFHRLPYQW